VPKLYIVLEGGPGVGKTSISTLLARLLEPLGHHVCLVHDSSRQIATVLTKLFGEWHQAPRELIEYMILGHQVHGLQRCKQEDADIIILDYNIEAPLAYMETDGTKYPRELDRLAETLLGDAKTIVLVLERPITYNNDEIRWEPLTKAQKYSRNLVKRALSLVKRINAKAYIIPEKRTPPERTLLIATIIKQELEKNERSP